MTSTAMNLWCAACGKRISPPNWVVDGLAYCFDCDSTGVQRDCEA